MSAPAPVVMQPSSGGDNSELIALMQSIQNQMNSKADLEHLARVENDSKKISEVVQQLTSKIESKVG